MNARLVLFASSVLLASVLTSKARAAGADTPSRFSTETERAPREGYGWQTILSDGASALTISTGLGLATGSTSGDLGASRAFFFGGVGMFALGAPVVHLVNDEPLRAAGSFGIRVALPALGFLIGSASAPSCRPTDSWGCSFGRLDYGVTGVLFGMLGATVVDASLLAFKPSRTDRRLTMGTLAVASELDPVHGIYGLSLVATGL